MAHPVAASLPHAARSARPRRADARARRSHPRSPPPRAVAGGDAVAAAEAWLALDADADTRAEIQSLVDAGDDATLAARLDPSARLEFGTAGLRGEMGAGYDRMNDLVVLQTTQGLCDYLLAEEGEASAKARGVLVGYDARRKSEQFARTAASVFASRGVRVHLFKDPVPTPLVAFGVTHLGAAAGICVTASHNPKQYNGYKVYWGNGCQIIPPRDAAIAASILTPTNLTPWRLLREDELGDRLADFSPVDAASVADHSHPLVTDPTSEVRAAYHARVRAALCDAPGRYSDAAPLCYTPLHGVGAADARLAFEGFGLPPFVETPSQIDPDPDFSTVAFPNPEEGAETWAEARRTAEARGCAVCVANDPDADRLAACEYDPMTKRWRAFRGNEIGAMLAAWTFERWRAKHPDGDPASVAMLASAVSSKMLRSMADAEGFRFEETLTGFKWLGNVAQGIDEGPGEAKTLFAFEEAIGFMFGDVHRDKDGISAAAVFAEMTADAYEKARSSSSSSSSSSSAPLLPPLASYLATLHASYGHHATRAAYFVASSPSATRLVFETLRASPPERVGPARVRSTRDLGTGVDTGEAGGTPALPWTPGDSCVTYRLAFDGVGVSGGGGGDDESSAFDGAMLEPEGAEVTLRASGTEPKLKYYLEVVGRRGGGAEAEAAAEAAAEAIERAVWEQLVDGAPGIRRVEL